MVKTIITPQKETYSINIPNQYIGREIEVLLYAKDELIEEKVKSKKVLADFAGILSENDYNSLKSHADQARKEWNRDI